ncbi:hypothetical protein [Streptomyces sp. NPDC051162]
MVSIPAGLAKATADTLARVAAGEPLEDADRANAARMADMLTAALESRD